MQGWWTLCWRCALCWSTLRCSSSRTSSSTPRVVGKSVGLSPLYTLVAAMIGGKLFGILFFIPLTAVVLELVKEDACRRLRTKETLQ